MTTNRIYQDQALTEGASVTLDQRATHHLLNVLRMRQNDSIVLFNGDGNEYEAQLLIGGKKAAAQILSRLRTEPQTRVAINLIQGISRGDRMDWCIQKAVELGASCITPVYCERSMKAPDEKRQDKKNQHWLGIIISACEQSGRCTLPELKTPQHLNEYLRVSTAGYVLDPRADVSLPTALSAAGEINILIGPEGGLSDAEVAAANATGLRGVRLGPRILRTETAGVAALAVIQAIIGDFK